MTIRTKGEQKAYLDGYEMCAECIEQYLSDEGKEKLECLLMAVRSAVNFPKCREMQDEIANLPKAPDNTDLVLNKIKAKILEEKECAYADFERYKVEYLWQDWEDAYDSLPQDDFRFGMERCIDIIDKYKAEK